MRKIEINYTNEYGEKFSINREVQNDFQDTNEIDFLHNSYKVFLNNFGYPVDCDEQIVVLGEDEFIDTYCNNDDYCDGDCENCDIDEDDDEVDYNKIGEYATIEDGYIKYFNNGELTSTLKIPENKGINY